MKCLICLKESEGQYCSVICKGIENLYKTLRPTDHLIEMESLIRKFLGLHTIKTSLDRHNSDYIREQEYLIYRLKELNNE